MGQDGRLNGDPRRHGNRRKEVVPLSFSAECSEGRLEVEGSRREGHGAHALGRLMGIS